MGEDVKLVAKERTVIGKGVKRLRREGFVPAIIYGDNMKSKAITLEKTEAVRVWRDAGRRRAVEIKLPTSNRIAMIASADFDPVKHKLRHLSFYAVKRNEKVQAQVPVKVVSEGQTEAEKAGLILLKNIETAEISALPKNLPEFMEVPGEKLVEPGDSLKMADIIPADDVEILSDPEQVVVTVYEPSALVAANEAAEEEKEAEEEGAETEEGDKPEEEERKSSNEQEAAKS